MNRLGQVLATLAAFQQVQDDEKPVSRYELEAFMKEAFGVSYSAKSIADLLSKQDGKQHVRYEKNKGYRLRELGEARAKELMANSI
jgi:Mn-dependent DtxR family transcriptional regulator